MFPRSILFVNLRQEELTTFTKSSISYSPVLSGGGGALCFSSQIGMENELAESKEILMI